MKSISSIGSATPIAGSSRADSSPVPFPPGPSATVVLTGAGVSAESGIPTFRGPTGLWRDRRPEDLATPSAFARDPQLVWDFYRWRRSVVSSSQPNRAHQLLAELEAARDSFALITQNVDGLHSLAGSRNVVELHGSLWRDRCSDCGHVWEDRSFSPQDELPTCPLCNEIGRPDVVWFGESLDPSVLELAFEWARNADLMLIVGTSAVVQPAAQIPLIAEAAGARLIEFNLERTPLSAYVDEIHLGAATETLETWWKGFRR